MKRSTLITMILLGFLLVLGSGCSDTAPSGPVPGLGSATVTKYVAIGNSLTAGYQSNALYASAQNYSFPKLISQQVQLAGGTAGSFEQPLYGDPGTPDPVTGKASRYEIISMVGPVIGPRGLTPGSPTNSTLARPYDNLGVPGAVLFDFLDTTNVLSKAVAPRNNPMFLAVLRNQAAFGKSIFAQVRALKPDLVTFWLGNNDVLGYATSGGASPSAPTPGATFAFLYQQALDSLRTALPSAKIVVANIPDVRAIPFFTTLGPKIAAAVKGAKAANPAVQGLVYQKGDGTIGVTMLDDAAAPLITLTGSAYAPLIGRPTGKWYTDKHYPALPTGVDTTKAFGLDPQNPWPNALALDAAEQTIAGAAVSSFNGTIAAVAASHNAAVVDINGFFNSVKASGYYSGGQKFTSDYVSGGLFSLDGVHPSSRGAGVLANEFLRVMNAKFGMNVPFVDVSTIPGIPAPVSKEGTGIPVIPYDSFRSLETLWGAEQQ